MTLEIFGAWHKDDISGREPNIGGRIATGQYRQQVDGSGDRCAVGLLANENHLFAAGAGQEAAGGLNGLKKSQALGPCHGSLDTHLTADVNPRLHCLAHDHRKVGAGQLYRVERGQSVVELLGGQDPPRRPHRRRAAK